MNYPYYPEDPREIGFYDPSGMSVPKGGPLSQPPQGPQPPQPPQPPQGKKSNIGFGLSSPEDKVQAGVGLAGMLAGGINNALAPPPPMPELGLTGQSYASVPTIPLGPSGGETFGASAPGNILSGVSAGAAFGPVGMAVGGALGIATSIIGAIGAGGRQAQMRRRQEYAAQQVAANNSIVSLRENAYRQNARQEQALALRRQRLDRSSTFLTQM